MSRPHGKLRSLQGLRGIAIILVVVFHLFPRIFSNGFVGVDMFFVLSGYLISMLLSEELTMKAVFSFYQKRFIRIVPLYYITICVTALGVLCFVLRTERTDFLYDFNWCLQLISNFQPIFEHHTYWDQVSSIRYLTHLWSLCTELQYYLMAPIIQLIASSLPFFNRLIGYSIAIFILFFFQLLTPFELSYCFLASRVWQFLLGSFAFDLSRKYDTTMDLSTETTKTDMNKWRVVLDGFPFLFLAMLSAVVSLPWVFGEHTTRLIMSLFTSFLCFLCKHLEESFLTLQPLVAIGNISYVTYLIHWPVINFVRYIQQRDYSSLNLIETLIVVIIVIVLSLLAHFLLEKKLLQCNIYVNLVVVMLTIGICLCMVPWIEKQQCFAMESLPDSLIKKAEFNLNETNMKSSIADLGCDYNETTTDLRISTFSLEYCSKKGNGTGIIMVIGNSLSIRVFPTLFNLFGGKYKEIILFARHAGAPLLNLFPYYNEAVLEMAHEIKPDLLWIIQGMNEIKLSGVASGHNYETKALDEVVSVTMDQFKSVAKMIFVDLPYFVSINPVAKILARSLIYRKNIEERLSASLTDVHDQIHEQTERLRNLNCKNCFFNDVQKALTNGSEKYYFYEKGSYKAKTYDGSHISLFGYEYIKPLYQQRIDQYLKFLNSI